MKWLTPLFAAVTIVLFILFGSGGFALYKWRVEQVSAQVMDSVKRLSARIQEQNMILNNMAGIIDDPDYKEKTAFAAGVTGNTGKMRQWFDEDQELVNRKIANQNFDARHHHRGHEVLNINQVFLKDHNVHFEPQAVIKIGRFDSLFREQLKDKNISLRYRIHRLSSADTTFKTPYTYSSAGFIINFYDPKIYRVDFDVYPSSVLIGLVPYATIGLLLLLLVTASYILFRRSYRIQSQMVLFRESLFSNITHELKTPLSSLQIIIESALQEGPASLTRQHIGFAGSELNRMKLIVDKILSFGKMSSEQFELNKTLVDLDEVIKEAIDAMTIVAGKTSETGAVINYHTVERVRIAGDRVLLVNMITTLIDNSIKYSNGVPDISITLTSIQGTAVIKVADKGPGIPHAYREKIFEPFFRIPTGDIHDTKGHGLGLSFAMQVAVLHKGSIVAGDAEAYKGAVFIIKLPAL